MLDCGFKRHVSGIQKQNRDYELQTAYKWMYTWLYELERKEGLDASRARFTKWLESKKVKDALGENTKKKIQNFSDNHLLEYELSWARYPLIAAGIVTMGIRTTQMNEAMHYSIKSGDLGACANDGLAQSASRQVEKTRAREEGRDRMNAKAQNKTHLWTKSATEQHLVTAMENRSTNMMQRRTEYAVVQVEAYVFWVYGLRSQKQRTDHPEIFHPRRVRKVTLDHTKRTVTCTCGECEARLAPCVHVVAVFDISARVMWHFRHTVDYATDYGRPDCVEATHIYDQLRCSHPNFQCSYDGVDTKFLQTTNFPHFTRRCDSDTYELMKEISTASICERDSHHSAAGSFEVTAALSPTARRLQQSQQVESSRRKDSYGFQVQLNKGMAELMERVDIPHTDTSYKLLRDFLDGLEKEAKRVAPNNSPKKRIAPEPGLAFPTVGNERRKKVARYKSHYERRGRTGARRVSNP